MRAGVTHSSQAFSQVLNCKRLYYYFDLSANDFSIIKLIVWTLKDPNTEKKIHIDI